MSDFSTMIKAGLLACVSATGVAAQDANTEVSGDISVWTWPNNDRTFEALLPLFAEQYPNVTVEIQGFPQADSNYLNVLRRGLMTGAGPDVAMLELAMVAQMRDLPQFADLSQPPYEVGDQESQFADFAWSNVALEDGRIIALPKHTGPGGFFYRADIWEEAGFDPDPQAMESLLSDWDALYEAGQEVAIPNERWIIGSGDEIVRAYMAQNGLTMFDAEGELNFDNPVMIEAFDLVERFAEADLISPFSAWSPEWQGAFAQGQIASVVFGNWFGGLLKRAYDTDGAGHWRVTRAPAAPNGVRAFNWGGDYIGIIEGTDNPEAALAFVEFIVSNDDALEQQYRSDDLYPAYLPAAEADWLNYEDPYYGGQNVNEVFSDVQENMVPLSLNPDDSMANSAMMTAVDNVVRGIMTPQEALEQAARQVEARR